MTDSGRYGGKILRFFFFFKLFICLDVECSANAVNLGQFLEHLNVVAKALENMQPLLQSHFPSGMFVQF